MFIPCIVWLSVIDQHYALSYITPLFDTQAPTYFGIHVPSSGSFLYPRELLESRNVYVVCHILWMLVACVHWLLWFRVLCCPAKRMRLDKITRCMSSYYSYRSRNLVSTLSRLMVGWLRSFGLFPGTGKDFSPLQASRPDLGPFSMGIADSVCGRKRP
jgi:hypothetical protein